MSTSANTFNPFISLGIAADAAIGAFTRLGPSAVSMSRANGRSQRAGPGRKTPNPAGTKLARKARERKLGLRWC